ncbi:MAG TPA: hypothetical protein ACFYD6_03785 [Candidatus Brocadiia bacterium]|nr:hypothetical protein [Candidatus Brocadiales bacterium]
MSEDFKVALGLALTMSLFGLFGFLPSILHLVRGILKKLEEK